MRDARRVSRPRLDLWNRQEECTVQTRSSQQEVASKPRPGFVAAARTRLGGIGTEAFRSAEMCVALSCL